MGAIPLRPSGGSTRCGKLGRGLASRAGRRHDATALTRPNARDRHARHGLRQWGPFDLDRDVAGAPEGTPRPGNNHPCLHPYGGGCHDDEPLLSERQRDRRERVPVRAGGQGRRGARSAARPRARRRTGNVLHSGGGLQTEQSPSASADRGSDQRHGRRPCQNRYRRSRDTAIAAAEQARTATRIPTTR
jgi:hypothetical protein